MDDWNPIMAQQVGDGLRDVFRPEASFIHFLARFAVVAAIAICVLVWILQ